MTTSHYDNQKFISQNQTTKNRHCSFCDRDNHTVENCLRRNNATITCQLYKKYGHEADNCCFS